MPYAAEVVPGALCPKHPAILFMLILLLIILVVFQSPVPSIRLIRDS